MLQGVVLKTIAHAVKDTSELLRSGNNSYGEVGTTNTFGDKQLQVSLALTFIIALQKLIKAKFVCKIFIHKPA